MPPIFGVLLDSGMCKMADLRGWDEHTGDPVMDLADVCTLNEILIIKHENELRANRHATRKSGQGGGASGRASGRSRRPLRK